MKNKLEINFINCTEDQCIEFANKITNERYDEVE